jgi:hypothetical protein
MHPEEEPQPTPATPEPESIKIEGEDGSLFFYDGKGGPIVMTEDWQICVNKSGLSYHRGHLSPNCPHISMKEMQEIRWEQIREKRRGEAERGLPFPQEALRGLLGGWSQFMAYGSIIPSQFYLMLALTFLGHLLAKRRVTLDIARGRRIIQPRLNTLVVDDPSGGKGTCLRNTTEFFASLPEPYTPFVAEGVNSAEGLQEHIAQTRKTRPDLSDAILAPDEFSALLKKTQLENATLGDMLNTLFEHTRYETHAVGRHVKIDNLRLSLCSTIQIKRWTDVAGGEIDENGFTSRLLLVTREGKVPKAGMRLPPLDEGRNAEYARTLAARLIDVPEGYAFPVTDEAVAAVDQWWFGMPQDNSAIRLNTIGDRLMLLLAFDLGKTEVDLEVVQTVIALLNWQYAVRIALAPSHARNTDADCYQKIVGLLKSHGSLTRRQLGSQHKLDGIYSPIVVDRVLEGMAGKAVERITSDKDGKPDPKGKSEAYRLLR